MLLPMYHPHRRGSTLLIYINLFAAAVASDRSLAGPPIEIARRVIPSVVLVTTEDELGGALARASGFVVAEGIIATNLHVIRDASKVFVKVVDAQTNLDVLGVVAEDREWDLILLAVKDLKAPPLTIGDSAALQVGDDVFALGNPYGPKGTLSAGSVSNIRRIEGGALIQITAPVFPGGNGAPIVNNDAEVVGVAVASLAPSQGLNFALSSGHLGPMLTNRTDPQPLPGSDAESAEPDESKDDKNMTDIHLSQFVHWMAARAQQGESAAMLNLGVMYSSGWGVDQSDIEAATWFRKAADLGDAEAMNSLGMRYAIGEGVVQDDRESVAWFRKAAEAGNAEAMYFLGLAYQSGQGVLQDDREAVKWLRNAADLGSVDAMLDLGQRFAEGTGVAQDDREAMQWYRKAINAGNAEAMYRLGSMYAVGQGVAQDFGMAAAWLRKAADQEHANAMFAVAMLYANARGVPRDDREAAKWYRRAAENGQVQAMYYLGLVYDEGKGVVKDDREAVKWYRTAAEQGYATAMAALGVAYANGRGVGQDDHEAAKWYRRAADFGVANAMVLLGMMYANGEGVEQDDFEAYTWLTLAVTFGVTEARETRDLVGKGLTAKECIRAQTRANELAAQIQQRKSR